MTGSTTKSFERLFDKLPLPTQKRVRWGLYVWLKNPFYPSLFFKKIFEGKSFWSIRITKNYRAIGYFKGGSMYWF